MTTPPLEPDAPPSEATDEARGVHLTWQIWFDGEVARAPLALADGAIVVVDHGRYSSIRRVDEAGQIQWEVDLDGRASGDPVRTLGWLAVPCDGTRVIVLALDTGARAGAPIHVTGLVLRGPIAGARGHVVARFASAGGVAEPFLAIVDLARRDTPPTLLRDPLGAAIETRYRATNHTFIVAGEDASGFASVAALDDETHALLWQQRVADCGLSHLWAAGGLVDVVFTDRVTSFDARSGTQLSTRFEGMVLDTARIAGETLIVTLGAGGPPEDRILLAFDTMTEEALGEHRGFQRVIGACSDECLVTALDDTPLVLELPGLVPRPIRDGENVEAPRLVAWSRHRAYVVGHGGHSLSAIDLT